MKRSLIALTLLAALPFAAGATEGLSYNYVEGGYVSTDADDDGELNSSADGVGVKGSVELNHNFHLFGGFSRQGLNDLPAGYDADIDNLRLGLGYNHEIGARTDLVTGVAYERYESDIDRPAPLGDTTVKADGYSVEAGVRSAFTPNFEGYALAGYEDGDDFDGDFYGRVGAQVKFNQSWGISGDVKVSDGNTQWFVGPRLSF